MTSPKQLLSATISSAIAKSILFQKPHKKLQAIEFQYLLPCILSTTLSSHISDGKTFLQKKVTLISSEMITMGVHHTASILKIRLCFFNLFANSQKRKQHLSLFHVSEYKSHQTHKSEGHTVSRRPVRRG